MPQRPSGRHVGVSYERLPDWAESAPWGKLSEIVLSLHTVEDFLLILDLLEYADSDRPPSPLNPAAGKPFLSPVRISELNAPACPWAADDQTALLEWLHAQHLQRMFDHAAADLHAILHSASRAGGAEGPLRRRGLTPPKLGALGDSAASEHACSRAKGRRVFSP